jgi:hypothetical protein
MMNWIFVAMMAISLSFATTACSNDSGGGRSGNIEPSNGGGDDGNGTGDGTPQNPIDIDTKSCVYNLNEGDDADLSRVQHSNVQSVSFAKKFNAEYLRAVGRTDIPGTVQFINQTTAEVYQSSVVHSTVCARELFAALPKMPRDVTKKWRDASPKQANAVLMGLYLPKDEAVLNTDLPSVKVKAAIVVRTNTSRWTLVHEFMHHLFMLQAATEGYNERAAWNELLRTIERTEQIDKNTSLSVGQKLDLQADNYPALLAAFDSQMVHFTLEEMTIEKTMKEYLRNADLAYAPESSNWYIQASASKAKETYNNVRKFGQDLIGIANNNPGHQAAVDKINAANRLIDDRVSEMNRITASFPDTGNSIDHSLAPAFGLHEGCSHENQADDVLQMAKQL